MYLLASIIAIETVLLCVSSFYLWKFSNIILKVEDEVEVALDALDERYASISKILQIPIFYDSPEIKKVVEDVKASRDVILNVARKIASVEDDDDNER
jgi:hypothetical protein